jgi:hypothetical protein
VTLFAFGCEFTGSPKLKRGTHRWVSVRTMKSYPFPSGSARIVRFLEAYDSQRDHSRLMG